MKSGKIAILGAAGQLGTTLRNLLGSHGISLTRDEINFSSSAQIHDVVANLDCQIVINCAAYNQVDKAEEDEDMPHAWNINWKAPLELAKVCRQTGKKLVHVSTDYVFGLDKTRSTPYSEEDLPGPESIYGLSKLAGEYAVRGWSSDCLVVRTCGLFGKADRGGKMNFIDLMIKKGNEGQELKVVNDQVCSPTSTVDLAQGIIELINADAQGLFHVVNRGASTWYDFAKKIFELKKMRPKMTPVTTKSFGAKARRPEYSVLSTEKYTKTTGKILPGLDDALEKYLAAYHP